MISAIVLAAGSSVRMRGINKQLACIDGIPVFVISALCFERSAQVGEIIIAAPENDLEIMRQTALKFGITKLKAVTAGGETRAASVKNALAAVSPEADLISIHDGARPLITTEEAERVFDDARIYGAAIAAIRATDTVKVAQDSEIRRTLPRESLWYAQTPQVFAAQLYRECLESLGEEINSLTDDSSLLEACGRSVHLTEINCCNMKITRPDDLAAAEAVFRQRQRGQI
ncbi:MAG: 2-C-methyl-D-erythritol 4-phosphate cytidylyltransferase [Oscillospiraceae bacterium]